MSYQPARREDLRIGLAIKIAGSWFNHPFSKNTFKITGSVANNVFEGNKGFYLRVPQTRIVNFTGVFQLGPT